MRELENINIRFSGLLTTLLTVLFVGLKLTNYIDWSWWWVLSPIWVSVTLVLFSIVIIGLIYWLASL